MSTALFDYYEANKERHLDGLATTFENSQHQHIAGAQARHSTRGRVPGRRTPRDGHEERRDYPGQGGAESPGLRRVAGSARQTHVAHLRSL